jgi:hypothetical protein
VQCILRICYILLVKEFGKEGGVKEILEGN